MASSPTSILELAVPKPVGAVVGAIVLAAFLLFFVMLAIFDLLNWQAIIPSVIWLSLVSTTLASLIKKRGIKRFATDVLGAFSFKQFVQMIRRENGQNEIQFGYQMFGYRLLYFTIPVDRIERVNWSPGQATGMAGRDMNDWSVAVWYDHGDPIKSQKKQKWLHPDQDVYIVGPMGRKQKTAAFGLALLDFLRNSGASLGRGDNECTFVRQPAAV